MKILIVKPLMTEPRFHFDWTIELSKYMEVMWICGWMQKDQYKFSDYVRPNHDINVVCKSLTGNRLMKNIHLLEFSLNVLRYLRKVNPDIVLVHSYQLAFVLPIFAPGNRYLFMTFTTSVNRSSLKRWFWDRWGRMNRLPYRDFLIATPEMAGLFHIPEWKSCYLTRWGMKPISKVNKEFDSIRLLYIGVLNNRNIHQTIYGLKLFIERNPGVSVTYSIIGSGDGEHVRLLADAISACKLETIVKYHGYLSDEEIKPYFDACNVGVSYVPITPYYTDVIVTKTIEYLLSGLVTIATETNKNKEMINGLNGVLVKDNPESFMQGLEDVYLNLSKYDSSTIMTSAQEWDIEFLIRDRIAPLLFSLAEQRDCAQEPSREA